jgi:hypothetical protein
MTARITAVVMLAFGSAPISGRHSIVISTVPIIPLFNKLTVVFTTALSDLT